MKKILTLLLCVSVAAGMLFAQTYTQADFDNEIADAAAPLKEFSSLFETYAIGSAVQHNTWDDAYIGKVFPSFPPHFGAGASANITLIPMDKLGSGNANSLLGGIASGSGLKYLPLPSANGNIRIGGIVLPFDIGVHFMKLPITMDPGISIDYTTFGADVRYAIMEEDILRPDISVGIGATVTQGSIAMSLEDTNYTASASSSFKATIVTAQAQVSKKVLFLIPYAGARFSLASGTFGWDASAKVADNAAAKYTGITEAKAGETTEYAFGKKSDAQVFGGLGLKFLIFDNNVGVSYDFMSKALGVNVDLRIKI